MKGQFIAIKSRSNCSKKGSRQTHQYDFGGHEEAETVEPLNVRLEVLGLLHVFERRLQVRSFFGKRLYEFLRTLNNGHIDRCWRLQQQLLRHRKVQFNLLKNRERQTLYLRAGWVFN